jgi:uncharacterized protein YeaO (DUF488 family)
MTVAVYTARVSYSGPDRLDVTRKSAVGHGMAFAPSWKILGPMVRLRRVRCADGISAEAWARYVADYTVEMRASYRGNYPAWGWLLAEERRTLVCYCTDPAHCHRTVLAGILATLGAKVMGER